jgi:hypothetical protein
MKDDFPTKYTFPEIDSHANDKCRKPIVVERNSKMLYKYPENSRL